MRRAAWRTPLGLLGALVLSTAGCGLLYYGAEPAPEGEITVEQAPPPSRAEVAPPCPSPAHVWCPGHWFWHHGRHEWQRGRWEVPPRRSAVWAAPTWDRVEHGWHYTPGHWQ